MKAIMEDAIADTGEPTAFVSYVMPPMRLLESIRADKEASLYRRSGSSTTAPLLPRLTIS